MNSTNTAIDIIIPVYNALEDLKICLDSIYQNTDLKKNRIILIDDNSSDIRVKRFLQDWEKTNENIIKIYNTTNRGFSANINLGMSRSKTNDVILLNSDTVVTKKWVEKMCICAYSDPAIGTVTPLSNNASLCSVPAFCRENMLPTGISIEDAGTIAEWCSFKEYPDIAVANGFCMLIKREVIDEVGGFDEKTFGRGYGEENDFCYRAEQAGYRHVMCDNTYIYHKGTRSFTGKEKERYKSSHDKILYKRYPSQMRITEAYYRSNPNKKIGENIDLFFKLHNKKKNLLLVAQSDFREHASNNVGGIQRHIRDLVFLLKGIYNIFVVTRDNTHLAVTAYIGNEEIPFEFQMPEEKIYPSFSNKDMRIFWENILSAFRIDIIHLHHIYGISFDIFDVAEQMHIPVVLTMHDFYFICPTIKLLDEYGNTCVGKISEQKCCECLHKQYGYSENLDYISIWRNKCLKYLEKIQQIVVPSDSAREIILYYYPSLGKKIRVIEHEIDKIEIHQQAPTSERLNVAFIGGISDAKGGKVIADIIKKGPAEICWYVFGTVGTRELQSLEQKNLVKTGRYEFDQLPGLFQKYQINVVCILSIWPETYSYTLTEAVACQIPVIVSDIGALGERTRKNNYGWTVRVKYIREDTLDLLQNFLYDKSILEEKRKGLGLLSWKGCRHMGNTYVRLYEHTLSGREKCATPSHFDPSYIYMGYSKGNPNAERYRDERKYEEAFEELGWLKSTLSYRLVMKLSHIHIPYKQQIKKLLMKSNKY